MNPSSDIIVLYNRRTGGLEEEAVAGRAWMDLFYGTAAGRRITAMLLCRPWLSRLYGAWQQHPASRRHIVPFVRQFGVVLQEARIPAGGFASFNDFFIRRLQPGARPVETDPRALIAPADSRLQVFELTADTRLQVKGSAVTVPALLDRPGLPQGFEGGCCLVFRLAPCDYHRFGYVDDGRQGPVHSVPGLLHSVNPLSLKYKPDVHCTNQRQWCFMEGRALGTMIQVEVGAMLVGSIVQHQPAGGPCRRGGEKGYFQFGGSTVILVLPAGRVRIDADIRHHSAKGIETLVRYGEKIGQAVSGK